MIEPHKLRELLSYGATTGTFTTLVSTSNRVKVGQAAGSRKDSGYIEIMVSKSKYLAHRLAWLYVYGVLPKGQIDHINGIKDDNRICNLREATPSENTVNRGKHSNNTSGFKGVTWDKVNKKWKAQCMSAGRQNYLGLFHTAQDASLVYLAFAEQRHGNFFNSGEIV